MSIIIFGDSFTFPEGNAATNRVHTYARGFHKNGIKVHVICFLDDFMDPVEGEVNGIYYHHPIGKGPRSKYFLIRRWQKFSKYLRTFRILREINRKDRIAAINCWSQLLVTNIFAWILARFLGTPVIQERSEHPLRYFQDSALLRTEGKIKAWIESRLCDGIFCISHYLVDYYKSIGIKPHKLFLVPSTVDPERFMRTGEKPLPFPYIGYFGGLTFERDNVDLLIQSFSMISKNYPGLHLVLGGFCSDSEKKQIEAMINELQLSDKIRLLKYLSREEIVNYILHSEVLVMVRKDDMKAHASFPSKLTEYLASGRPVISVNVGEIPDYMIDGTNTFLVEPGNREELADKLDYVLTNYDLAMEVARKGNELAYSVFNYNYQGKRMIGFIRSLRGQNRKHQPTSNFPDTLFTPAKARA